MKQQKVLHVSISWTVSLLSSKTTSRILEHSSLPTRHALHAVHMALDMQQKMTCLNENWPHPELTLKGIPEPQVVLA